MPAPMLTPTTSPSRGVRVVEAAVAEVAVVLVAVGLHRQRLRLPVGVALQERLQRAGAVVVLVEVVLVAQRQRRIQYRTCLLTEYRPLQPIPHLRARQR